MYIIDEHITIEEEIKIAIKKCQNHNNGRIFSYTFSFELKDLMPLISHSINKQQCCIYWEQKSPNITLAGLNKVSEINLSDYKDIDSFNNGIKKDLDNIISITNYKGIGPRFIGGHAFDIDSKSDTIWRNFPRGRYVLPECLATKTDDGTWITISRKIYETDDYIDIYKEFSKTCKYYTKRLPITLSPIQFNSVDTFKDIPNKSDYLKTISSIVKKINLGEIEKTVISRLHKISINENFSFLSALQILRSFYPQCTNYFFNFPQEEGIFFGSTPERLIKKNKNILLTEALAGTAKRGNNIEEDCMLADRLFNSHKERKEHQYVIDQIKLKLKSIYETINISSNPYVLKLKNVQHLKTIIDIETNKDYNILELIKIMHPTPAVAGTPMDKAIDIIKSNELNDRGWYSGPIGWIDENGNADIFVALRSALLIGMEAYIFTGSGIVSESVPEKEWEETELKLEPILTALSGGQV